jgi:hypothetical protein
MVRNFKVLGIAVIAMFAMSAVMASMASADKFKAESAPVTYTGNQEEQNVFTTTAGTVKCTTTTFKGTVAVTETSEASVAPTYAGCTAFGFPAHIDVNGCTFLLKIGAATTGTADVVCPAGQEITVTATTSSVNSTLKCTVHVPAQTNLGTVTYSNTGAGATREVLVAVNLAGNVKYSHTAGTGLGACTSGSAATGSYKGSVKVTGENAGGTHVGVFVS